MLTFLSGLFVLVFYHTNDISETSISMKISSKATNTSITCPNYLMDFLGDGICDDEANVKSCLYDGNDCCQYSNPTISRSICTKCFCQVDIKAIIDLYTKDFYEVCFEIISEILWSNVGDGICNEELNNLDNMFDAGDCCLETNKTCLNTNLVCDPSTMGDGLCHDFNNGPLCDYDLGDCCIKPSDKSQCCWCWTKRDFENITVY